MSNATKTEFVPPTQIARRIVRLRMLSALAVALGVFATISPLHEIRLGLGTAAATLLLCCVPLLMQSQKRSKDGQSRLTWYAELIQHDGAPSFITNEDGIIQSANQAAARQFEIPEKTTLTSLLNKVFANAGSILYRLQSRAAAAGSTKEEIATKDGHFRLSVQSPSQNTFVWRLDQISSNKPQRAAQDGHLVPMLMVGRTNAILFMNEPARRLIGTRARSLDRVFTELPVHHGMTCEVSTVDGPKDTLLCEVQAGAGRRALFLMPAVQGDADVSTHGWQAVQELPVPMIKVDHEGAVIAYNRMASTLVGVTLRKGIHLSQLMEGLGRSITDWLQDTIAGRHVQKSEFLRLTRADQETFVQVVLNQITENGEPSLIAVLHDATELKSLEAQFVQSQKMQAIGQLAGGVAHDFNNLLTAIGGHCDLLLLRHDQSDQNYGDLVQISQNANRAAALVGQLLAFSRKQTLRPETLDMRDTLADLTHLLNRLVGEKITLTLSHDPVLKPIRADKRQLEQVLMNLVVNARDAMPEGGEIRVETEIDNLSEPLKRDRVTVPAAEYVTVKVSDDGFGIPADKLTKVFEPFFTTKKTGEGTGLGLSTAYGIVKQSGGFIFVDSTPGTGTTFTLYFPIYESEPVRKRVTQEFETELLPDKTDGVILLVEDEAPVRAFASRALRLRGFTVLEADSAESALKTLEDDTLSIDVFVTDVVMPGMDGPSWVREALKVRPGVRVVFVSGYAEDSFGEEQPQIPNSVFLPKPFSLNDLTQTVQKQLH